MSFAIESTTAELAGFPNDLMRLEEAARMVNCSTATITRWRQIGLRGQKLPTWRVGGQVRVSRNELVQFLEAQS